MSDTWINVFESEIEGRCVKGETYGDGGYRVFLRQNRDLDGAVYHDDYGTTIIPPSPADARSLLMERHWRNSSTTL